MQHKTEDRLVSRAALDRVLEELHALADEALEYRAKSAAGAYIETAGSWPERQSFAVGRFGGLQAAVERLRALPDI